MERAWKLSWRIGERPKQAIGPTFLGPRQQPAKRFRRGTSLPFMTVKQSTHRPHPTGQLANPYSLRLSEIKKAEYQEMAQRQKEEHLACKSLATQTHDVTFRGISTFWGKWQDLDNFFKHRVNVEWMHVL